MKISKILKIYLKMVRINFGDHFLHGLSRAGSSRLKDPLLWVMVSYVEKWSLENVDTISPVVSCLVVNFVENY